MSSGGTESGELVQTELDTNTPDCQGAQSSILSTNPMKTQVLPLVYIQTPSKLPFTSITKTNMVNTVPQLQFATLPPNMNKNTSNRSISNQGVILTPVKNVAKAQQLVIHKPSNMQTVTLSGGSKIAGTYLTMIKPLTKIAEPKSEGGQKLMIAPMPNVIKNRLPVTVTTNTLQPKIAFMPLTLPSSNEVNNKMFNIKISDAQLQNELESGNREDGEEINRELVCDEIIDLDSPVKSEKEYELSILEDSNSKSESLSFSFDNSVEKRKEIVPKFPKHGISTASVCDDKALLLLVVRHRVSFNMLLLRLSAFFFLLPWNEARFYKDNVTDFTKCQIYYSRSGSVYKDFFELNDEPLNGSLLDFHFSVMSPSDAHILLAPSTTVEKGDPVYEIVIGAGGNTFCDIRRRQKSSVKATVRIKGLLSALDQQSFWIHMSKDGVIDVGKEGEELGFLTWTDPDPLPLKVFSFSTWPGVEAKWYFDCPRGNKTTHSKEVQKPLTFLEQLRRDLLSRYDPYVRPVQNASDITVVGLQLETSIVTLDEYKSVLETSGTITLNWMDEKMRWNVSNYGGLNTLHIFRREIWVPHLFLFNAVVDGSDILEDTMLIVNSTGHVSWLTKVKMNSWCSPDDLGRWPRDEHVCDIVLGFFKDFQNLQLIFKARQSLFSNPYSSKWEILEAESYTNKGWSNSTARNINNFDPPGLTLHLKIKRASNSYTVVVFTPFFVIAVSILATFWTSPFSYIKLSLPCFQLVLASIILIALALIIPIHSQLVPNIVLLYSYTLVAIMFCIIVEIVVVNLSRNEQKYGLPHFLTKTLVSFFLKTFLCLPDIKSSAQYGNLNESFSKLNDNHQGMWILLGIVIDRIAFFIYLGLVVYAYCITY